MISESADVVLVDAWRDPAAQAFFRNVWPMYLHEISGFDTKFYALDAEGRWLPDIVEDWISSVTPEQNLREPRAHDDPAQPFQRTHVIVASGRPVGFVSLGVPPFKYMADGADVSIAEFFLIRAVRGSGVALRALELVLGQYVGRWHLLAIHDNARAIAFWRKTLPQLAVRDLEQRDEPGDVIFRFVTGS